MILSRFLDEVWSNGEIDRCDTYLADTYTIHHDPGDPWDGQSLDLEGFENRVTVSRAPFPDQQFHVKDMLFDESKIMVTWDWRATHLGVLPNFPVTGSPMSMSGSTVYYFNDAGKITGHWQVTDRLGIYHQMQQAQLLSITNATARKPNYEPCDTPADERTRYAGGCARRTTRAHS
jgi:predicted ester cyclase